MCVCIVVCLHVCLHCGMCACVFALWYVCMCVCVQCMIDTNVLSRYYYMKPLAKYYCVLVCVMYVYVLVCGCSYVYHVHHLFPSCLPKFNSLFFIEIAFSIGLLLLTCMLSLFIGVIWFTSVCRQDLSQTGSTHLYHHGEMRDAKTCVLTVKPTEYKSKLALICII